MKKILYTTIMLVALSSQGIQAQYAHDAAALAESDLTGTARYVGMGGALGALGADMSVSATNPAGLGMFRRADASVTFGTITTGNQAQLNNNRTKLTCDQAGGIFSIGSSSDKLLKNVNVGVNYIKKRNNHQNFGGIWNCPKGYSQTYQIAELGNQSVDNWGVDFGASDPYNNWLTGLAYYTVPMHYPVFDDNGDVTDYDSYLGLCNDNLTTNSYYYSGNDASRADYRRSVSNFNSEVDITFSGNVDDRVFFGVGVGIYSNEMNRQSSYSELGTDGYSYTINNTYLSKATGWDIKAGIILRPIEESPFRVGLSVHTPTWYVLRDNSDMNWTAKTNEGENLVSELYSSGFYECRYRTPWVINASLGHTIGSILAIGAEYEYQDLGASRFSQTGADAYSNDNVKANLQSQHTAKFGLEVKPTKTLSVRAGYNFVSSPYKKNAAKNLDYFSSYTETDYTNWDAIHRVTAGLGVKVKNFYADLAYQYQMQNGSFYPYYSDNGSGGNAVQPISINNNRHSVVCTLGFRF